MQGELVKLGKRRIPENQTSMKRSIIARITQIRRPSVPGRPDQGLPGEPEVSPPIEIDEDDDLGAGQLPEIPVGIWPPPGRPGGGPMPPLPPHLPSLPIPPTAEHPIAPIPPGSEHPDQGPVLPPGTVWPPNPLPPRPEFGDKYIALALIYVTGLGWKWRWIVLEDKPAQLPTLPQRPQPK